MNIGISVTVRFVGEKEHLQVPFYFEKLSEFGNAVEAVGVFTADKYRNNVPFVSDRLCY